ncbi:PREDICTED: probable amino acid permease 7 [Ipomoea nil]|uniref:probable amino acid permease 7 n=1 Tax=Ipomoea nil TaxID=35883 RepID=UPI000901B411|nr:PREDICTED: probable amino acid permease 7 [Ipomoea nil]
MQMEIQHPSPPKGDPILSDGHDVIRTGTVLSAVAHIIAAVIGAGVLSLAWSTAQLGWIAGPVALLCFAVVTYISVSLISQCYMSPSGHRNPTYMDAVRFNLGRRHRWMCGLLQYVSMYGTCIAYVITTSTSMRAIEKSNCYHENGHEANCNSTGIGTNVFMLVFGIAQIFASQIPDFHNMAWLSIVAALMSFGYASIGLGLGFATVIENRAIKGSITGVSTHTGAQKMWLTFQAIADISFAYPYTLIVLEIQDTLKSPPPEHQTMNKASLAAILITTFFYTCCGCFGYAAFGSDTPGNLLTGFGFYEPYWLVDLANACIILHLVGGYQIYCQPIFAFAEKWFSERFPRSRVLMKPHALKLPYLPAFRLSLFRLCFRTAYVASTTGIAMLFPYFNQVLGVLGAVTFWPLAVYFPVEMYIVQRKIGGWTRKWVFLQIFSMICLCVSIVGLVGSIEGLITEKLS